MNFLFEKIILFLWLSVSWLYAQSSSIDLLLNDIAKKTDLSSKTKLENGGVSYIYTREDLRKMQAYYLKDILKSIYPFAYKENNYGFSDPYTFGTAIPFLSSNLRIYIDNQEISTGLFGSGMLIYGDMDIDFIDHIEVYTGNPTLEISSEPATTIIKLYSRVASRDAGSRVVLHVGSYGAKGVTAYNTQELNNGWSYFSYLSTIDNSRKKYYSYNNTLSRDTKTTHVFGTYSKKNQHFLIDGFVQNRDSFIAESIFATPKKSIIKSQFLHAGYDGSVKNWYFLATLDKNNADTDFDDLLRNEIKSINSTYGKNLPYQMQANSTSEVYTVGIKYKMKTTNNRLTSGVKYRYKHFVYTTLIYNDAPLPRSGNTNQITTTLFMENQYYLQKNQVFTGGVSYSKVTNNHSPQENDLYCARIGYTYTNEKWISKTIYSHTEVGLDPYLVNSIYLADPYSKTPKERQNIFIENIKYTKQNDIYEMIASKGRSKNRLVLNQNGKLYANKKETTFNSLLLRYTHKYRDTDKIEITAYVNTLKNLAPIDSLTQYNCNFRSFNSFKKFDIFNELLYYRDTLSKTNYIDYSAGVIYHINEDMTVAMKGANIFNKAKKSTYVRLNPQTLQQDTPLKIPSIDPKINLTFSWTF